MASFNAFDGVGITFTAQDNSTIDIMFFQSGSINFLRRSPAGAIIKEWIK